MGASYCGSAKILKVDGAGSKADERGRGIAACSLKGAFHTIVAAEVGVRSWRLEVMSPRIEVGQAVINNLCVAQGRYEIEP
jgi:hypothetical protein